MTATLVFLSVLLSWVESLKGLRWGLAPLLMAVAVITLWANPSIGPWELSPLGIVAVLGTVAIFHGTRHRSFAECLLPTLTFLAVAVPDALGITLFLTSLVYGLHQLETKDDLETGPLALRLTLSLCVLIGASGELTPSLEIGLNAVTVLWLLTLPRTPHFAFVFGIQGLAVAMILPKSSESALILATAGFCGSLLGARNLLIHHQDRSKMGALLSLVFSWFLVLKSVGLMDWVVVGICALTALLLGLRGLQWTYGSHSPKHWVGASKRAWGFFMVIQTASLTLAVLFGAAAGLAPSVEWQGKAVLAVAVLLSSLGLGTLSWVPRGRPAKVFGKPGWLIRGLAFFFLGTAFVLTLTAPLPLGSHPTWLIALLTVSGVGFVLGKSRLVPMPKVRRGPLSGYRPFLTLGATVERVERLVVDRIFLDRGADSILWLADRISSALSDPRSMPWVALALLGLLAALLFGGGWA